MRAQGVIWFSKKNFLTTLKFQEVNFEKEAKTFLFDHF